MRLPANVGQTHFGFGSRILSRCRTSVRRNQNAKKRVGALSRIVRIDLDSPDDLVHFRLLARVNSRPRELLDRQDSGIPLKETARPEAEGPVELAEFLTLFRLSAEGAGRQAVTPKRP